VLIVHRPRYDDWTLPKGKVDPGESDVDAALREVFEETGYRCRIVATLPETMHWTPHGPKSVAWFAMRPMPDSAELEPDDEIDEVRWVTPEQAALMVDYENDRRLIREAPYEELLNG
jgi:8-oxo-dGTP diphosphatase